MTLAKAHEFSLWKRLQLAWNGWMSGQPQRQPEVADAARDFLSWSGLIQAAKLRWRATHEPLILPSLRIGAANAVESMVGKNRWAQRQLEQMNPTTVWVVNKAVAAERDWQEAQAVAVEAGLRGVALPDPRMLMYRQRRFRGDASSQIHQVATQIQLADPEVGRMFLFATYHTREDARVRTTHGAMDGLVAMRTWEGWKWCRPPCGFGCRCTLRFWSESESIAKGFADKSGKPRFVVRWPSPMSKANYLRGVAYHGESDWNAVPKNVRNRIFPDAGWGQARFVADVHEVEELAA